MSKNLSKGLMTQQNFSLHTDECIESKQTE